MRVGVRCDRELKDVRDEHRSWGGAGVGGWAENIPEKGSAGAEFCFRGNDWALFASGRSCMSFPKLVHFCYTYTALFY